MTDAVEKIIQMPIKDFAKKIICDGHVFLRSKEGRRFYLLKPGIFIEPAFVKKFAAAQTVFEFQPVTNETVTSQFSTLFKELRYLQYEKDLREKTKEIVSFFRALYQNDEHFLSFALACYYEFNAIALPDLERMHDTDLHLFRKSLYSGAFAVIIGLCNDFYHYPMIKDFYNITLGLDIGLCDTNYSYFVAEACNKENLAPGSGRNWLTEQRGSEQELQVFLDHPARSYEFFKTNIDMLSYPELAEIVLYQHELSSGLGFPRGIPKGQVSSWEAVVVLATSMVEISADYDFERKVLNYIFDFGEDKLGHLPVQRVYKKMCIVFGDIYKEKRSIG